MMKWKIATLAFLLTGPGLIAPQAIAGEALRQTTTAADQSEYAVTYQINPAHSGAMTFKAGFKLPLKKVWATKIPGTTSVAYPLIADGKVFLSASSDSEVVTDAVYALNLTNGSTAWSNIATNANTYFTGLAYDNNTVFVQTGLGLLAALSAKSGNLKWSLQVGSAASADLTAVGGLVYPDAGIVAVNENTGNIKWVASIANVSNYSASAVGDKGVYIAGACIYDKINPKNGDVDWSYTSCQNHGGNSAVSVYHEGLVYIEDYPSGNFILDAQTGNHVGNFQCGINSTDVPTLYNVNGQTMGFCLDDGKLAAWDASSGTISWSFTGDSQLYAQPIVVNGFVFVGSIAGTIYALDAANGKVRWSDKVGYPGPTSFAAGQGKLIVAIGNGGKGIGVAVYAPQ